jgi:hypothetical protein
MHTEAQLKQFRSDVARDGIPRRSILEVARVPDEAINLAKRVEGTRRRVRKVTDRLVEEEWRQAATRRTHGRPYDAPLPSRFPPSEVIGRSNPADHQGTDHVTR